jgi:hypothetical protein
MYYSTRHLCTKGKNNYTNKSTSINGVYVILINNKLIIIIEIKINYFIY